jgi:hypothetical protein
MTWNVAREMRRKTKKRLKVIASSLKKSTGFNRGSTRGPGKWADAT